MFDEIYVFLWFFSCKSKLTCAGENLSTQFYLERFIP